MSSFLLVVIKSTTYIPFSSIKSTTSITLRAFCATYFLFTEIGVCIRWPHQPFG
ncbi:hypothetical protein RICGR_0615 [Rickettsiella grylli]|uniref:Uncharacterized protein n=1 Tax=Rickettsiella grylli TaxID=59196 RepID=A8PM43_9COXI|nr:hypothetical protein RICGR_0615 [Rickettsiella grylli]